jgi:putative flavoprotein involved in K+ transport
MHDVIIVGAGQAGLAAGWHLKKRGIEFIILEKESVPGGSWPSYYDSLELFSPARYSALPGSPFPGDAHRYPKRDEVISYLRHYAKDHELPVIPSARVSSVTRDTHFEVTAEDSRRFQAKALIVATGGFGTPYLPETAGQQAFEGSVLHSCSYRTAQPFQGKRVVVVGGGNSAVQIACELAPVSDVTLAVRSRLRFLPQRILGRDLHFWLGVTGLDRTNLFSDQSTPVIDVGRYRRALKERMPPVRKMFSRFWSFGVEWGDGNREHVDAVIFGTGFRYRADFLADLGVLDPYGEPLQRHGRAAGQDRLFFVGIPGQRGLSSATLRGVGRDAASVVRKLSKELREGRATSSADFRIGMGEPVTVRKSRRSVVWEGKP